MKKKDLYKTKLYQYVLKQIVKEDTSLSYPHKTILPYKFCKFPHSFGEKKPFLLFENNRIKANHLRKLRILKEMTPQGQAVEENTKKTLSPTQPP